MGVTTIDQQRVIADLDAVWSSIAELVAGLDDAALDTPTCLPGWDVRAVVAHVIGTESMLLGDGAPPHELDPASSDHVRNDIGKFNEAWVASMPSAGVIDLVARLEDHRTRRLAALRAMDRDAWDAEGFTPAGRDSYGRFMRIRVFDCWLHEQDVRDAVGRPGHESGPAVETTLDEMEAALGYIVGKRAGAPAGARVRIELTGDSGRTILVEVGERAMVVDGLTADPTVTLTMPVGVFTRLAAGRVAPAAVGEQVEIDGDEALGQRIVDSLAFTI